MSAPGGGNLEIQDSAIKRGPKIIFIPSERAAPATKFPAGSPKIRSLTCDLRHPRLKVLSHLVVRPNDHVDTLMMTTDKSFSAPASALRWVQRHIVESASRSFLPLENPPR
jgi:hypothetical protein